MNRKLMSKYQQDPSLALWHSTSTIDNAPLALVQKSCRYTHSHLLYCSSYRYNFPYRAGTSAEKVIVATYTGTKKN
jgi:hypothetical protein